MCYTSSLRSSQPSVYHTKMGESRYCLSQRHNVLRTVRLMLTVKQKSCKYQFFSHWFDQNWNQTQVYSS